MPEPESSRIEDEARQPLDAAHNSDLLAGHWPPKSRRSTVAGLPYQVLSGMWVREIERHG